MDINVKKEREDRGITQQELADKTGIPKDRISKWETGVGNPKVEDYKKLVAYFTEDVPRGTLSNEMQDNGKDYKSSKRQFNEKDLTMQVLLNISENGKILAEASLKTAEAASITAQSTLKAVESTKIMAENNSKALELVETTAKIAKESLLNDDEILLQALGKLIIRRMGDSWQSEQEAVAVLSQKILKQFEKEKGTHVVVRR